MAGRARASQQSARSSLRFKGSFFCAEASQNGKFRALLKRPLSLYSISNDILILKSLVRTECENSLL